MTRQLKHYAFMTEINLRKKKVYLRTTNLILDNQAGKVKVNSNDPKSLLSVILLQASTEGIHEK